MSGDCRLCSLTHPRQSPEIKLSSPMRVAALHPHHMRVSSPGSQTAQRRAGSIATANLRHKLGVSFHPCTSEAGREPPLIRLGATFCIWVRNRQECSQPQMPFAPSGQAHHRVLPSQSVSNLHFFLPFLYYIIKSSPCRCSTGQEPHTR